MSTAQLLEMEMWQFTAYCDAWELRVKDQLSIQLQSAYYNAYWNSATKNKKSLEEVLSKLHEEKHSTTTAISKQAIDRFELLEEVKEKGYAQAK